MSDQTVALIQPHGRATPARVRVLDLLRQATRALSHGEIEARLESGDQVDRVTLYRVLDWLVSKGLAHRVAGEDRAWRFNAVDQEGHQHAHFLCRRCGQVYCLDATPAGLGHGLPPGFMAERVELNVVGLCAACAAKGRPRNGAV